MTTATASRFETIRIENLIPSPHNPRKHFDEGKLAELARSLASDLGQEVPLLVRPHPDVDGAYEILDGERRWRASKLAELKTLEAKVIDCDNAKALEITVVANLQREDITALEEASGVASLLAGGRDVDTIARDLGKSVAWVYLRAKLINLSPEWRKAATVKAKDGRDSEVYGWPASMLEQIARFPAPAQAEMLKNWQVCRADSAKQLSAILDREYTMLLKSAPWKLDDADLIPKAGACSACPKRSSCQQQLFTGVGKDDRCTDAPCWKAKGAALTDRREKELRAEHPDLVVYHRGEYRVEEKGHVGDRDVETCKKTDPKAKPALVISAETGNSQLAWVKERSQDQYGGGGAGRPKGSTVSAKERVEQRLRRRREVEVKIVKQLLMPDDKWFDAKDEPGLKSEIDLAPFGKPVRPDRKVLVALAATFGLKNDYSFEMEGGALDEETWENVAAHAKLPDDKLDERLWARVVDQVCHQNSLEIDDDIAPLCKLVNLDAEAITFVVRAAMPLSRTLAAEWEEDGTKKTGLTAKTGKNPRSKPAKKAKAAKPAKATKPAKKASKKAGAA